MLNPSTNYAFSEADLKFVLELAKVGYVHLLSNQVSLLSNKGDGLSFTHYSNDPDKKVDGLKLPDNWLVEGIYASDTVGVKVLFKVNKQ